MIDLTLVVAPGVAADCDRRQLTDALAAVLDEAGVERRDDEISVDVRLVDEAESADLNGRFRNKPYATNVLSFSAGARLPGFFALGDLVICIPVVASQAAEQGKTVDAHLLHMVVHGGFHLLGFDHIGDDEAEIMEAAERRVMARLGQDDPYAA
ncbi:rRNA maturation RNase YbeY [Salinisphaera sp.]|uniref:rRNA maturation RNase YbeY n=1 Tax=Salinisphaera sp. TaxID=1914330 RepID=UPI002D794308|nr:rRNA maturation RNase YbeY [Salinisphaera sp.]HET7313200.1 rRNA maturation RNase YbeY [Salinisphaera sp.]